MFLIMCGTLDFDRLMQLRELFDKMDKLVQLHRAEKNYNN